MEPIVLASSSPRRAELLKLLHIPFKKIVVPVDESIDLKLSPERQVEILAYKKAAAAAATIKTGLVIGADTIVVKDALVLGKPENKDDAVKMLSFLSGCTHEVFTGIALISVSSGKTAVAHESTKVFFKVAEFEEIKRYVDTGEPLDKAGAYAAQGLGAVFIKGIEGCFFNVVGLPLAKLNLLLNDFGVKVF